MDRLELIVFMIPWHGIRKWIARRIGQPVAWPGVSPGWTIGTKTFIADN